MASLNISGFIEDKSGAKSGSGYTENLDEKYNQFINATSADHQLTVLKNILCSNDIENDDTMRFIAAIYITAEPKHPLKSFIARYVTKSIEKIQKMFERFLLNEIRHIVTQRGKNTSRAEMSTAVVAILCCSENFPVGTRALQMCREPLVMYLEAALRDNVTILSNGKALPPTEKNEIFTLIHIILRSLLNVFQKADNNEITDLQSFSLICTWINKLLAENSKDLPLDTKALCGILIVTMGTLKHGANYWIKFIEEQQRSPCGDVEKAVDRVCQYAAVVTVVPVASLESTRVGDVSGLELLVQEVLAISEMYSSSPPVALCTARALLGAARALRRSRGTSAGAAAAARALAFVWSHAEHHADSVRHLAEQLLAEVLKYFATHQVDPSFPNIFDLFFAELMALPRDKKAYYVGLAAAATVLGTAHILRRLPGLIAALTCSLSHQPLQAIVAATMNTLLKKHIEEVSTEVVYESWVQPILRRVHESALSGAVDSDTLNILENIISYAIKCDRDIMDFILPEARRICSAPKMGPGDLKCVLVCLNLARRVGSLREGWRDVLGREPVCAALVDPSEEVRILALSLLIETSKSTEHFTEMELELFLYYLKYNINTQAPNLRHLTLSLVKKLMKRLESSYRVLKRQDSSPREEPGQPTTRMYTEFLSTLREQCFDSLLPGANYSRRAIALEILEWCETLDMEDYESYWCEEYVEKLIFHLEDSYENNKRSALNILTRCPTYYLERSHDVSLELCDILVQASSVKPPDCMSAAYKLQLIQQLYATRKYSLLQRSKDGVPKAETVSYTIISALWDKLLLELNVAQESILVAASRGPMYGLLYCIHHLLARVDAAAISGDAQWTALVASLLAASAAVTRVTAPVVSSSSPEGHLPMDASDAGGSAEGGTTVTAQMVLLCAWRSVKEVSLLLGVISRSLHISGEESAGGSWSQRDVLLVGEHFTTLLAETKHRGAFEQAYVGFTELCTRLWQCKSPSLHCLPGAWLAELTAAIASGGGGGRLCATRRSAGVPFMIQALVTTELQVVGAPKCFHGCMDTLLRLASFESRDVTVETRTHCLNVLRALYRHTGLGAVVYDYVERGLLTAVRGFEGTTWAERNSSTLLFSSLMVRVFGVQRSRDSDQLCIRNRMTGRTFFLRYPGLYDFMLVSLSVQEEDSEKLAATGGGGDLLRPALYPVLLILARLYPYTLEETTANLKLVAFVPHVVACGAGGVLKTRQLAAKALVPLVSCDKYIYYLNELMKMLANKQIKRNFCHGILLQLIRLLEWKPETLKVEPASYTDLSESFQDTFWILEEILSPRPCYITADEYLKLINLLLWRFPSVVQMNDFIIKIKSILIKLFNTNQTHDFYGKDVFLANAYNLNLILFLKFDQKPVPDFVTRHLNHDSYEVVLSALNFTLLLHNVDNESKCKFQTIMLASVNNEMRTKILKELNKSQEFRRNLFNIVASKCYQECVQKALTVLSLLNDTQEGLLHPNNPNQNMTSENIILKLIDKVQTEHESVSHIYIVSLRRYVSTVLCNGESIQEIVWIDIVRVMYESCSSENGDRKRGNVVDFMEEFASRLSSLQFKELRSSQIFEYHSTIWATLMTLLEDDVDVLRQRTSDLVLQLSHQNGAQDRVIPSKASEILLNIIEKHYQDKREAVAVFLVLALLDFNSEVCIGDDITDECRVFDSNEKYNIFLEESNWTKECVSRIRAAINAENSQAILRCIGAVIRDDRYSESFQRLCPGNHKAFTRLFPDCSLNDVNVHPKVQLCIKMLCK